MSTAKNANNVMIRDLQDEDRTMLDKLRDHFHTGYNSKALLRSGHNYLILSEQNDLLRDKIEKLEQQIRVMKQGISKLRDQEQQLELAKKECFDLLS